jgi:N-acetylglucosamine-6-sulfatase
VAERWRRRPGRAAGVAIAAGVLFSPAGAADRPARPNIVFILVDDLRWDEVDYPFVQAPHIQRLAREGMRFRNAFVTTPLCSPSRASFLTGQHARAHGITDNTDRSARSHALVTFPRLLHDSGYRTAFLGKWHMGVDDSARPGFDHWVSVKGQGSYLDPEFNVNGERRQERGYFTDILNGFAVDFLKQDHGGKPFLLYLAHKAVHPDMVQYADGSVSDPNASTFIPAARHRGLYAGAPIPHRPNHGRPAEGKPALLRPMAGRPPLGPGTATRDETVRDRLRMLAAVDEGLGQIFRVLESRRLLDDTLIVLTSDEGYFYGEHGLSVERRLAYEESARIPLLMRWPRLIEKGASSEAFVLNIDLAPTLLEAGGAQAARGMHGRSLVPHLKGETAPPREAFLIEYFSDRVFPWVVNMGYHAVRTERWKYIHYVELDGMDELYDLRADPFEMKNLIADPAGQAALRDLKPLLARLVEESR